MFTENYSTLQIFFREDSQKYEVPDKYPAGPLSTHRHLVHRAFHEVIMQIKN